MTRWNAFPAILIALVFVTGCSRIFGPEVTPSPPLEPEVNVKKASPTAALIQTATPVEPPPATATSAPTPVILPSPTWTLASTAATDTQPETRVEQIVFGPGEVSAVKAGQVDEVKVYSLYALEGQIMQVVVRSRTGMAALEVFSPGGSPLAVADPSRPYWRSTLLESGEYRLVVLAEGKPIDFELSVLVVPLGDSVFLTTYQDQENGFAMQYSDYFGIGVTRTESGLLPGTGVVTLVFVGNEYYEGTNLRDVGLTVNVNREADRVAGCLEPAPYEHDLREVVIRGVPFVASAFGEASMGSIYEVEIFRRVTEDACYEIWYRIRSANMGVFGPGSSVQEYDANGVRGHLMDVIESFQFLQ